MIPISTSHALIHTLHQLSRNLTNRVNEVLKPFGLYSAQWAVIFVLKTRETLTQKELCEYLSVEAPPLTRTIQRLVKQGYVKQVQGYDKREKHIQLTEEALRRYPEWEKSVNDLNHSLLKDLPSTSQDNLSELLKIWLLQIS
ncbi:winged helix DNA-binding protein [Neobacillus sp. PS3-40]|uniref:MarR family winged helix-turn-helix transcriptional regulator n=1 Tax=Neobacillus sp. PS3-40 TaxID=3070679 RepID=UPI0027E0B8FF|nr:MarR family transcriptional regulator [Neobacillus sp. PS3-40]WML45843.1 MarR family transcriptional regulator [Neobacillus sp. PS3-40]